jgi:hypothetical protein
MLMLCDHKYNYFYKIVVTMLIYKEPVGDRATSDHLADKLISEAVT